MTGVAPWSVKGIDRKAREVAKDHARRSGLTLGEWLNRMILEDEAAVGEAPRAFAEPLRAGAEVAGVVEALDRLAERIETSETRTGLAIAGVEHSVRAALARVDQAEHETQRVAARLDETAGAQTRLVERLKQMDTDAAGPRSTEALRAIEQAVGRTASQVVELEARLSRSEAHGGVDPEAVADAVLQRVGQRLAAAEGHTADAIETLRRSLAGLDGRLGALEGGQGGLDRRFERLAEALGEQVSAARAHVAERLQQVDEGRLDRRFAELAGEVEAAERRAQAAVQGLGRELLSVADGVNRRLQAADAQQAEALDRLGRAEQAQTQALARLSQELVRISETLGDRMLLAERRAAEAIDDVGRQVLRVSDRMAESQARAAEELAQQIRDSEARTAQLLEAARDSLARKLDEPETRAPEPSPAAFGPELFSRAEETDEDDELDLLEPLHASAAGFAPRFETPPAFAPIPDPEEDLFGLDQPEPPPGAEVNPTLSTRQVIEQARAEARSTPAEGDAASAKGRSWSSGGLFGVRPRRGPSSTLQTAIMVAGGAAFLSVGAAGVVLMQGPQASPQDIAAAAPPRAAVALTPDTLSVPAERPAPAATPDALSAAYAGAVAELERDQPGALAKLTAVADAGFAPAQLYLGKVYETGAHGVAKNLAEARRWTEEAAEGGDAAAMHNLAMFAFRGEGGPQDLPKAVRWFRAAAERGVVDSQYNLGLLYQSGSGVTSDPAQAYLWFAAAAANGDAQARTRALEQKKALTPGQIAAADQALAVLAARQPAPAEANLRTAQRILGRLGYQPGPATGVATPVLRTALSAYQRDHQLPVTGQLDAATLQRLKVFDR